MFQSGCHGNWTAMAMGYEADAYRPKNVHTKYELNAV